MARRDYRGGRDGGRESSRGGENTPPRQVGMFQPGYDQYTRDAGEYVERRKRLEDARKRRYDEVDPGGVGGQIISDARGYGRAGFDEWGNAIGDLRQGEQFQRDIVEGKNSLAAQQMDAGLQQGLAQQRMLAARGGRGDQMGALHQASINAANMSTSRIGKGVEAGILERRAAAEALARSQAARMGSGQGMAGTQGGIAAGMQGSIIGGQSSHYGSLMGKPRDPSTTERILGATAPILTAAITKSDERAKKDVKEGGGAAEQLMRAFRAGAAQGMQARRDRMDASRMAGEQQSGRDRMVANRQRVLAERGNQVGMPVQGLAAARKLFQGAEPKSYDYKDPQRHGEGRRTGVMAQDLAKSELGKQLVSRGADGMLGVDTGKLAMANAAATADLYDAFAKLKKQKDGDD